LFGLKPEPNPERQGLEMAVELRSIPTHALNHPSEQRPLAGNPGISRMNEAPDKPTHDDKTVINRAPDE
jgi:hypothetical protein